MVTKKKLTKKNESKSIELVREAPIERKMSITDIVGSVMAKAQLEVLTSPTPPHAIKTRPGAKGKALRYVSHGYVSDTLNKAFGFDWDFRLLPVMGNNSVFHLETVQLGVNPKTKEPIIARYISVYGELTVKVHNPKKMTEVIATVTKPGPGSAVWYPENEFGDAFKAAKSDGLKVAAHELGIALDLYWDDLAEQTKYEELQVAKQQKANEQTIGDLVEGEEIKAPANGVQLIAQAQSVYGLDFAALTEILGQDFINSYKPEMWEKLVKSQEEK